MSLAADAGQDALAVVSLIVPAVVFILIALALGAMNATAATRVPFWALPPFPPSVVVMIAWLAVVLLGLADAEGAAVVIAFISLTLAWLAVLTAISVPLAQSVFLPEGLLQFLSSAGGVPVVLASLATCSLAFSPARGEAWRSWGGGEPAS